ncbi:MAG: GNAT family N-acetyltransferase, partial [Bacteroidales bacterium]|nr:GNAT family N-acetyltransferase [Bacteroidales bacterium]
RKPLADWSFFESFYNQSAPRTTNREPHTGIGIIRLIRFNDRIIGGILAPVFENKCIYEWYVCGLDREYTAQYPSVLATWAAIDYAAQNGIECFDFMGVGRPNIPYGVRDFKARFGGEEVNYGRLTRINNRLLYHIAELGYNVLALFKKI